MGEFVQGVVGLDQFYELYAEGLKDREIDYREECVGALNFRCDRYPDFEDF